MAHRQEWEKENGPIPIGHEINHRCKNRKCINLDHLECLPIPHHRALDNSLRYKERASKILEYKGQNPEAYQKGIAKIFGITQSGVSLILKRGY